MSQRHKRLAIEFALAVVVCAAIAAFDRPLTGLIGLGLCIIIFAVRANSGRSNAPARFTGPGTEVGATKPEGAGIAEPSLHYDPTNTIYYPPER
jgi:hypothetical protein